jgi:cysteine desulfurase
MNSPINQAFNLARSGRTYFDHNATTPLAAELFPYLTSLLEQWGNPSSIHQHGRGPKTLIREARENFAKLVGVSPLELIFTSGGSEANNLALKGFFEAQKSVWGHDVSGWPRKQLITTHLEHPSVTKTVEYLRERGLDIQFLKIGRDGQIHLEQLKELLKTPTALVSVMIANNEVGSIFPIKEIVEICHQAGALVHTDAVQALGKIPLNLKDLGVDYASFSSHKVYSLKGSGVLYVKKGSPLVSLIHGGGQERGRRAGTENTLAVAALGFMAKQIMINQISGGNSISDKAQQMAQLREHFEKQIQARLSGVTITAQNSLRLPNTSSLVIENIDGESLLINLDIEGFSVSTGAACSSGNPEPSPTLLAMGLARSEAQSSLRVSFGWSTTREQIDLFIETLITVVERLRALRDEYAKSKKEVV